MIELLATVTVLCVLAALLLPLGNTVIDKARDMRCTQNLRQVYTGIRLYAAEHDNNIPDSSAPWHHQVKGYVDSSPNLSKVFLCPFDKNPGAILTYDINKNLLGKSFTVIPGKTLLLTESSNTYNIDGSTAQIKALLYKHSGGTMVNVLYADGAVDPRSNVPDATADPTLWKLSPQ